MIIRSLALALSLWLIAAPVSAHAPGPGPNGGQMQHLGNNAHVEVVARDGRILVYLFTPENVPLPAEGARATATVLAGGKPETIPLQVTGSNVMQGTGTFSAQPGMKVVLSITLPGGRPVQGRFTPLD